MADSPSVGHCQIRVTRRNCSSLTSVIAPFLGDLQDIQAFHPTRWPGICIALHTPYDCIRHDRHAPSFGDSGPSYILNTPSTGSHRQGSGNTFGATLCVSALALPVTPSCRRSSVQHIPLFQLSHAFLNLSTGFQDVEDAGVSEAGTWALSDHGMSVLRQLLLLLASAACSKKLFASATGFTSSSFRETPLSIPAGTKRRF